MRLQFQGKFFAGYNPINFINSIYMLSLILASFLQISLLFCPVFRVLYWGSGVNELHEN